MPVKCRLKALACKETGVIVGLVHPTHENYLFSEHQDRHVAYLVVVHGSTPRHLRSPFTETERLWHSTCFTIAIHEESSL